MVNGYGDDDLDPLWSGERGSEGRTERGRERGGTLCKRRPEWFADLFIDKP